MHETRTAVGRAYLGDEYRSDWEKAMAEIVELAPKDSRIQAIAAGAIVSHGQDFQARTVAFSAAGYQICGDCLEPIGLACRRPDQCPVCSGHGGLFVAGKPNEDCPGCEGLGTRDAYDERQEAASHAA